MEEVIFEILNTMLDKNIKNLKHYLKKDNIPFEKTKTNIIFETKNDGCNIEWNVLYKKNLILKVYCNCVNESSFKACTEFKTFLSKNFIFMYKNPITNIDYYECKANDNVLLNVENNQRVKINIEFVNQEKPKRRINKKDIVEILEMIGFTIFGVGISVIEYILYNWLNLQWLNILMAVLSVLFMMISCYIIFRCADFDKKKSSIISIVLPVVYWLIVFGVLLILNNKYIPDVPMKLVTCMYWAFYAMPAFILIISVALLLFVGASYA